jgi:hypothetical protein
MIRRLLEENFDDSLGEYLEGSDDQTVALAAKVPRVHVTTIREAAYGPIRVDPALAAARKEMAAVGSAIAAHGARLEAFVREHTASLQELDRRHRAAVAALGGGAK